MIDSEIQLFRNIQSRINFQLTTFLIVEINPWFNLSLDGRSIDYYNV